MVEKEAKAKGVTQEEIDLAQSLVEEALSRTGIKRKLLWEETRCRLLKVVDTTVKNFKAVPVVNWVATLVEKPIESAVNRAEWRKDTRKNQWGLCIKNEVRKILNEKYRDRSSVELKSTPAQFTKLHMDKVAEAVTGAIMANARNLSNKIAIGVSVGLVGVAATSQPWVLPIAVGVTGICTYQQRKINKRQIGLNVKAKSDHDDKTKEVLREHTQMLENSQYFGNIKGFSDRMFRAVDDVAENEIKANDTKQEVFRKNANANTNIMGFWGTTCVAIPMALSYFDGGFSAMTTTGMLGAASCATCASLGIIAINNYVNSKLEANEALKMVVTHMKELEKRDNTYDRGTKTLSRDDDTIVISKDMTYQHRNFSKKDAPLLGENLFRASEDIFIGKGVTVLGGASGAGKSTLTTLLRKGALATEGSIQLGHYDESGDFKGTNYKDIQNIVDNVGVAFQSAPEAECMSVNDYIMLENPEADPKKVKEVKELLGIGQGNKSGLIDENASVSNRLSGGQQKRIELARVLIKDSPIMILDEPTSGVDEVMSENIVEYLKELGKEKTIVYITHDAREIEKIGAYQAIDIDKKHSENGENVIKTFDLRDEDCRRGYIDFFMDRKKQTDEKQHHEEVDLQAKQEELEKKDIQKRKILKEEFDRAYSLLEKRKDVVDKEPKEMQSEKRTKVSTQQNSNIQGVLNSDDVAFRV